MSRPLLITIATVVLLGLSAFSVTKHVTNLEKDKTIIQQQEDITLLSNSLEIEKEDNSILLEENDELRLAINLLEEKIEDYEKEIKSLKSKLSGEKSRVKRREASMKELKDQYFSLEHQIAALQKDAKANTQTIQNLMAEKDQLRVQNDQQYVEQVKVSEQITQMEQDLYKAEMEKIKQERIMNIANNTQVKFIDISVKEEKMSNNLSKIKKNGKNWNYTIVAFDMINSNATQILDEQFVLKIIDKDANEAISFIETNPAFPDSQQNSDGMSFKYSGNKVLLQFKNTDLKTSSNYEIQMFYVENNQEYQITNATKQFIANSKVVY